MRLLHLPGGGILNLDHVVNVERCGVNPNGDEEVTVYTLGGFRFQFGGDCAQELITRLKQETVR